MHSRNGSLKHRPQLPPTMPWGFTPSPDYSGLGRGTNLIRVIVSHDYGPGEGAVRLATPLV